MPDPVRHGVTMNRQSSQPEEVEMALRHRSLIVTLTFSALVGIGLVAESAERPPVGLFLPREPGTRGAPRQQQKYNHKGSGTRVASQSITVSAECHYLRFEQSQIRALS